MYEPVLFENVDEQERREQPHDRVLPARERFDAAYFFGKSPDNGLIVSFDRTVSKCFIEVINNKLFVDLQHNHTPFIPARTGLMTKNGNFPFTYKIIAYTT